MPNNAPTKVSISPKAIKTELSTTPNGGTINPAMRRAQPTTISSIAESSWIVSFLLSSFIVKKRVFWKMWVTLYLCSDECVLVLTFGIWRCACAHFRRIRVCLCSPFFHFMKAAYGPELALSKNMTLNSTKLLTISAGVTFCLSLCICGPKAIA